MTLNINSCLDDAIEEIRETTVAIIGGGPAGLTAAILLAQRGIDVSLFERRATTSHLPRAHLVNVRTMEIFAELGVADDLYALSPPEDRWHRVAWYTSLAGPTPLHGRRIGHVHAWGGGQDQPRYAAASPMRFANVPQLRLDPALRRHAEAACPGRIHFHHEVVGAAAQQDGATLTVLDRDSSATHEIAARYVIVADGGRTCAELLCIPMAGPRDLREIVSQHVSMDLSRWVTDDQVLLTHFISADGEGSVAGTICAMGPDTWGRDSREWAVHLAFAPGDPAAHDRDGLADRVRRLLGIRDLQLEVHTITHWTFEGLVAERFRDGPFLLVGNAAHRHPPTGGLGLNAAVHDVHNLAWKLDAVLGGHAPAALLDTYEAERKPIADFYVQHSLANVGGHARIAIAMGLVAGQSEEDGWREIATWASDTPEGERRRAAVAGAVASNSDDYSQLNVEVGYAYERGALLADGTPTPATHASLREYTPTTRPGHHLPHAWLARPGGRCSTLDLIAPAGFTLLVSPVAQEPWQAAIAEAAAGPTGPTYPIATATIGDGGDANDPDGSWAAVRGVGDDGAVLVRPDRHVAWRAAVLPDDPAAALASAVEAILGVQERVA